MKAQVKSFEMIVAMLMRTQIMGKINTSDASEQLPLQTAMKKKKNSQKWSSEKEQLRVVKQRLRLIRLDDAFASCFSNHWSRMDSKKK